MSISMYITYRKGSRSVSPLHQMVNILLIHCIFLESLDWLRIKTGLGSRASLIDHPIRVSRLTIPAVTQNQKIHVGIGLGNKPEKNACETDQYASQQKQDFSSYKDRTYLKKKFQCVFESNEDYASAEVENTIRNEPYIMNYSIVFEKWCKTFYLFQIWHKWELPVWR